MLYIIKFWVYWTLGISPAEGCNNDGGRDDSGKHLFIFLQLPGYISTPSSIEVKGHKLHYSLQHNHKAASYHIINLCVRETTKQCRCKGVWLNVGQNHGQSSYFQLDGLALGKRVRLQTWTNPNIQQCFFLRQQVTSCTCLVHVYCLSISICVIVTCALLSSWSL